MFAIIISFFSFLIQSSSADCFSSEHLNDFFQDLVGARHDGIPLPGSCCMKDVCGLECPQVIPEPHPGYGIAVSSFFAISFIIGALTFFLIRGSAENFFVAGRRLPLTVLALTLTAQAIDSNSLLGNVDLSYKYSFWDGAVIPIGLGGSLILNGLFLAEKINQDNVITLPDILAKRYGPVVEVLTSIATLISFTMLLAGNLVGMGVLVSYVWGISESGGIWISAAIVWAYTVCGGLFSVVYTDVIQGLAGWFGCILATYWFLKHDHVSPPSIGFPGYIYPDSISDGGVCDMYQGIPCSVDETKCCYNTNLWCPNPSDGCDRYDRGAYPVGDQSFFTHQMIDAFALSPFPNAILWNWATILILAFGNLAALDFQARCMASKTPKNAKLGCYIGGIMTLFVGIPFSQLGAITRFHYGPDSVYGIFETDSCSVALGLPTCAKWLPDPSPFVKLLTHHAPPLIGGWCLLGIVAASVSTADGAILALGTVMANNVVRQFEVLFPSVSTPDNLLLVARISSLPLTIVSTIIAAYYRGDEAHAAGATGYLLIVAFDVVLAMVVVPLFGAFYAKNPSPRAALLAILGGCFSRVLAEFALPKDGSLLLPLHSEEFLDYGPAASVKAPAFLDMNTTEIWDHDANPCDQELVRDFTGVDSILAPLLGMIIFISVQYLENRRGKPIFTFLGSTGYEKDTECHTEKLSDYWALAESLFAVVGVTFLIFTVLIVVAAEKMQSFVKVPGNS